MKTAFVMTQSLDSPSGLGRYGPIAREMARLGHQVEIFALHYDWHNLPVKTFTADGVRVHYVSQMHVMKKGTGKQYFSPAKLLQISVQATLRLARALRQSSAEVIHLGKPQPFNVLAAKLGGNGRPIYCDCDDYEAETNLFSHAWQKRIVRYFEDGIVNDVTGLTVNTQFSRQRYIDLGFPAERIVYVPNGVERSRFNQPIDPQALRKQWQIPTNAPVILYVGTLGLHSHPVDLLLEAFSKISQQLGNGRLLLVGSGEDYSQLQQLAYTLGIADKTIFTGRISPEQIPDYYALADVSVDPVYDDLIARARSPLKIIESLCMGTPVVTSDVGDRRLLLTDGRAGQFVLPGDSQDLGEGLIEVLTNKEARTRMIETALASYNQWYWDHLVYEFIKIYQTK